MFSALSLPMMLSPMRLFLDWRLMSPHSLHGQLMSRRHIAHSSIAGTLSKYPVIATFLHAAVTGDKEKSRHFPGRHTLLSISELLAKEDSIYNVWPHFSLFVESSVCLQHLFRVWGHLTWALNGQPAQVTSLMYFSLASVNTPWRLNEWMGNRLMRNLTFYAIVLRSWGVSFLVFVSNLSRPSDVFLSIRGANLGWITSQHPTLNIDSRHGTPVTCELLIRLAINNSASTYFAWIAWRASSWWWWQGAPCYSWTQ